MDRTLSNRQLNRATLARQLLLERADMGLVEAVDWLIGLQGQVSEGPYQGLWSRLKGFRHEDLTRLIVDRTLVRATSLRSTLHLHTVDDLIGLRPQVQPVLDRLWKSAFGNRRFGGNDIAAVHRAGVNLLNGGPLTGGQLGKALLEQFPAGDPLAKSVLLQVKEILVQIPPTRIWGSGHAPILTRIENWVPPPYERELSLADIVIRYLRAYGPASVADMQAWSGLTKLGDFVAALRARLVEFVGEDGRTLFDLPDAPRPEADVPAPPRFLPVYDNAFLGYHTRYRMLEESVMQRINILAEYKPAVLVDGMISAGWTIERDKNSVLLSIEPYRRLTKREAAEVEAEGLAFLRFMEPNAGSYRFALLAVRA